MQYHQYSLTDEQGNPAVMEGFMISDDEDNETLITGIVGGKSPEALISDIANWLETDETKVRKMITGNQLITPNDGTWTIKKELVTPAELTGDDLRAMAY